MDYVEAPNYRQYTFPGLPLVFLGGGITGCPDWQKTLVDRLKDTKQGILLNPRRASFDIKDKASTLTQIKWEFDHLWMSDIIVFWFCKETIQPIVLLELGSRLGHIYCRDNGPKLIIGIEDGYSREEDVVIQTELALERKPLISRSLEEVSDRVRESVNEFYA